MGGPAAFLVNPADPASIREALRAVLRLTSQERQHRIEAGLAWVRQFVGWHKTADALAVALFKASA